MSSVLRGQKIRWLICGGVVSMRNWIESGGVISDLRSRYVVWMLKENVTDRLCRIFSGFESKRRESQRQSLRRMI